MSTLRDVAQRAGVSPATASRALSSPAAVTADKRRAVLEAAEELGYRVNPSARALATGRTGLIGLVVPDLGSPFSAGIAKGVQSRVRHFGRNLLIADAEEDVALERELVRNLQASTDAVVLCSPRMPREELARYGRAGRIVLVNREAEGIGSVSFDNPSSMARLLGHLGALGHRRVAYLGGPATSWSDAERRSGFGLVPSVEVVDIGAFPPVHGGGIAAADLALASGASAMVCYNDLIALGAMARLHERGVRVPGDVSVAGFDNVPASGLVTPGLTTVALPLAEAGREAVDLLFQTASDHEAPRHRLSGELVVRGSTAPPPPTQEEP